MSDKKPVARKKSAPQKTKIQHVQEMYGKDVGSATLKEASEYFNKVGYKSFADLLTPSA